MEADSAPFIPLPLSVLRFTGIWSYCYLDERKVEVDVEVTWYQTGDLLLRKLYTNQLSYTFFCNYSLTSIERPPIKRPPSIKQPLFKSPDLFVSKLL